MANIIAFLNPKGGTGKSTLAVHVAHALSLQNSVVLVDTDPQQSVMDWCNQGDTSKFPVITAEMSTLTEHVLELGEKFEWVVMDGAARMESLAVATIKIADLILIPICPSPLDVWAVADLVATIKARQEITDGAPVAAFVISKAKKNTQIAREVKRPLENYGFEIVKGEICDRTVFAKALADGRTAFDYYDQNAQHEINGLVKQIRRAFDGN